MAAQKEQDLLVKISDGASFVTVAGLRARRLSFNAETLPSRTPNPAGRWRELLDGAGIKRAASGAWPVQGRGSDALMRQTFFDGAARIFRSSSGTRHRARARSQITSLEFAGEHDGEGDDGVALERPALNVYGGVSAVADEVIPCLDRSRADDYLRGALPRLGTLRADRLALANMRWIDPSATRVRLRSRIGGGRYARGRRA